MDYAIQIILVVFSAVVHEVSHGLVAEKLGDNTARDAGRITLNPIPHLDPFASILLPLILILANSPIVFGAARPVPVNFNNLRNPKSGMALVSLAGPASNLALAVAFILLFKAGDEFGFLTAFSGKVLIMGVFINLAFAIFNIFPIPPLDGSKILASLGSDAFANKILSLERFGFLLVIIFLMLGIFHRVFVPAINGFFRIFGLDIS